MCVPKLWQNIDFYGKGDGGFEEDLVPSHMDHFKSDILITIYDAWAFQSLPATMKSKNKVWIPYVPIDADELNPAYLEVLKHAHKIIPMSKHSEDCLRKHFPDKVLPQIPPGYDPEIYKPLWETVDEKNELKKKLGFTPDTFLISMIGDFKSIRKKWAENIEAISIFQKRNPEVKLGVFIQTNLRKITPLDFNIPFLIKKFDLQEVTKGIEPYKFVVGISDTDVAIAYNASDIFLQASYGEGYGMSFCEAAACGTPSIGTDFSSMTQTIEHAQSGYLTKPLFLSFDQSLARHAIPNPEDIAEKIELIHKKGSASFRKGCVEFAKGLEWNTIIENQWLPTLDLIEKEIKELQYHVPEPSEILKKRSEKVFII